MQQIAQKLKNGNIRLMEMPVPNLRPGMVLVQNHFSLISAGTESNTVKTARKSLIGKAKERPQQVKQVLDVLKQHGPIQTYRAVMKKLDAYSPLGYSCAGEVIDVGDGVNEFRIGDKVACGGATAAHAEVIVVPVNLCVKLNSDADLRLAAYNTLGAIAFQGVRQADLRIGESCAVIGLGLLGQLTCLLLRAAGVRVIGIDINPRMIDIAGENCTDLALARDAAGVEARINAFTQGIGCDAVIITAASDSLDPINFAGAISRKRGTVVVVGAVPTGFDREPHYYQKELQVKMSCSYGPGRYDPVYEEKGVDYPQAYVRWTEKRNMQSFQDLLFSAKIDVGYLTTHIFRLEEAPAAYDIMTAKSEPFIGLLIAYDPGKIVKRKKIHVSPGVGHRSSAVLIGFLGAGSYAQGHLLPNIPKRDDVVLKGVMTSTGTSSRSVAERFGFEFCTGDAADILENEEINTIFIATRHDTHADYTLRALKAGKNVFVEKPLCLASHELEEFGSFFKTSLEAGNSHPLLMVGYNRRFSPFAQMLKQEFGDGPMAMSYRINAGPIPPNSWIQDSEVGGGRIIGEVCHFIDFLTFLNGSNPVSVHACALPDPHHHNDSIQVLIAFQNGSVGTVAYLANGSKRFGKERIELSANGCTAVIDEFRNLAIYTNGRRKEKKLRGQDKGQKNEVELFIQAVREGTGPLIPIEDILCTSSTCFKIIQSIHSSQTMKA